MKPPLRYGHRPAILAGLSGLRRTTMSFPTTRRDNVLARMQANLSMAELPQHDAAMDTNGHPKATPNDGRTPTLVHRMKHDKSILALAVSSQYIFAGTQGGEILVRRV